MIISSFMSRIVKNRISHWRIIHSAKDSGWGRSWRMGCLDGALDQIRPWSLYSEQEVVYTGLNSEVDGGSIAPLMKVEPDLFHSGISGL